MSAGGAPVDEGPALKRSLVLWMWAGIVVFLLLVFSFPLYRGVDASRRDQALAAEQTALQTTGRHLWALNCSSCHGDSGEGVDAPALNSKQFLGSVTDEQIHRIISAGITGTAMPAWLNDFGGPLTDEEIAAVVAYVRSWEKTAPDRPDWRTAFVGGQGP